MVVNHEQTSLFLLIFSLATCVRDAGVAGSNPATPTIIFAIHFSGLFLIAGGSRVNRRFSSGSPTQVSVPATHGARGLPASPSIRGGCRECRVHAAPAVSCAKCASKNAHEHTGSAEAVRHSLRNGFNGFLRALPGDRAFLSPSLPRSVNPSRT